jgi:choline dehydrogenase-like flavoprotein
MTGGALEQYLLTPVETLAAQSTSQPWDAVIVGGGTAGLSAARALAERGRRVAVLEGGPLVLLTHTSTTDLRFDQAGLARLQAMVEYSPRQPDGSIFGHLFACLGGRAMWWNGAAPRFAASDFATWPIRLADLEPFYDWAEVDFRVNCDYTPTGLGEMVCRQLRRAGLPAELGPYAIDTKPTRNGWIAGTVGNPVASLLRTNLLTTQPAVLQVAASSFVTRVLLDANGTTAHGVVVTDVANDNEYEVLARSVVLAAGGFESVRLAMTSKLGDRSGRMGTGIVDHLFCRAYYAVPAAIYDPTTPEAAIIAVRADDQRAFQLEIHMPSDALFGLNEHTVWQPAANLQYAAMVRSFAPVKPVPANHIELGTTGAPGDYTVHLTYGADDLALLDAMTAGLNQVGTALGANEALKIQQFAPGDSHHEAGGLIMGTDPTSSVTDAFGRFHSVPNVIVADAATWPITSAANPCLTISALARRQAQQLHDDLNSAAP